MAPPMIARDAQVSRKRSSMVLSIIDAMDDPRQKLDKDCELGWKVSHDSLLFTMDGFDLT